MVHYLDFAASTPVWSEALEEYIRVSKDCFANPSGAHRSAKKALRLVEDSQEFLADALGVHFDEIIFTSGGTESDNLAIKGIVEFYDGFPVCSAVEHHAVLNPVLALGGGILPVNPTGELNLDLDESVIDGASIVSVMAANNETGVIQPYKDTIGIIRALNPDIICHVDAVQAFCWLDMKEICSESDLVSISGHKFGAPKGVGALVCKNNVRLSPQMLGGSQERGLRAGTQNVAGIAALAKAAEITFSRKQEAIIRITKLRDRLVEGVMAGVDDVVHTGYKNVRNHFLPNIAHFCFENIESEALLYLLEQRDVMVSAAASCSSGAQQVSHVLTAMGYPVNLSKGSLRVSLGYTSCDEDVDVFLDALVPAVSQIREAS